MRLALIAVSAIALTTAAGVAAVPAPPVVQRASEATASRALVLPAPKPGHSRPLVVVVADQAGAETTDFIIPFGVLKDSGVADVRTLSTAPGPVQLMRAVKVRADSTTAAFDSASPEGADVVIVPAQVDPDSPVLTAWLKRQAAKGATVVSICEGARALGAAGLLEGRRVTTHWKALPALEKTYPKARWVRDRRYVQDGRIISTTGVSASIPVSLALVEAMGGRDVAEATARRIGVSDWSDVHRTADYRLTRADVAAALASMAAVWTHETLETPIADGTDEIALALRADAWVRSFRTTVVTTHAGRAPVRSRHGLLIVPDSAPKSGRTVIATYTGPSAGQLDATLADMRRRYGPQAARLATLGMEYREPAPRRR